MRYMKIDATHPLADVAQEQARQLRLWGEQNHQDYGSVDDMRCFGASAEWWKVVNAARVELDSITWDGILLEEVFEALSCEDVNSLREELAQVAAVAVSWIEAIDRRDESGAA